MIWMLALARGVFSEISVRYHCKLSGSTQESTPIVSVISLTNEKFNVILFSTMLSIIDSANESSCIFETLVIIMWSVSCIVETDFLQILGGKLLGSTAVEEICSEVGVFLLIEIAPPPSQIVCLECVEGML